MKKAVKQKITKAPQHEILSSLLKMLLIDDKFTQ
jgi:hypothetical protein